MNWYDEIIKELVRIIRRRPAVEVGTPLKSVSPKDYTWYLPVINYAWHSLDRLLWTFRLEFYRIDLEGEYLRIDVSDGNGPSNDARQ